MFLTSQVAGPDHGHNGGHEWVLSHKPRCRCRDENSKTCEEIADPRTTWLHNNNGTYSGSDRNHLNPSRNQHEMRQGEINTKMRQGRWRIDKSGSMHAEVPL